MLRGFHDWTTQTNFLVRAQTEPNDIAIYNDRHTYKSTVSPLPLSTLIKYSKIIRNLTSSKAARHWPKIVLSPEPILQEDYTGRDVSVSVKWSTWHALSIRPVSDRLCNCSTAAVQGRSTIAWKTCSRVIRKAERGRSCDKLCRYVCYVIIPSPHMLTSLLPWKKWVLRTHTGMKKDARPKSSVQDLNWWLNKRSTHTCHNASTTLNRLGKNLSI